MITLFDKKKDCCGCTACKSICPNQAITMLSGEEDFLYPSIDESICSECGLCKEVCAFQNEYETLHNLESPDVYALKHKSDEVRMNSSSGGAFSAISDFILSENGVIYGAAFDKEFRVIHKRAETEGERNKFRGSKYVQSDLKEVFVQIRQDLKNSRKVLFTGTPCQVAGLNNYLKKSVTGTDQLITVDVICHGVSSPLVFADYIDYCQEKNKRKITNYCFRSKVNGWGHTEETIYNNGRRDSTSILSQIHKELFYSNLCLRLACYNCKYTNFNRPSDITIADFWGVENYLPEFKDELGVSAVIINTTKGKLTYSHFKVEANTIASNIEECAAKQANMHAPTPLNPRRDDFWIDYLHRGFDYVIRKYTGYGFKKEFKHRIRYLLDQMGLLEIIRKARMKK